MEEEACVAVAAQSAWIIGATFRDNVLLGRAFDAQRYRQVVRDAFATSAKIYFIWGMHACVHAYTHTYTYIHTQVLWACGLAEDVASMPQRDLTYIGERGIISRAARKLASRSLVLLTPKPLWYCVCVSMRVCVCLCLSLCLSVCLSLCTFFVYIYTHCVLYDVLILQLVCCRCC